MRKIFLGLLLIWAFAATAQQKFNNEWIDYTKTYYKFKVGKNGLYRISAATLSAAGLGTATAEQFQLWRNGKEVPVYTTKPSGSFDATDYIEFWGEMNDGKPDRELYRDTAFQYSNKWSLLTDTAAYFLTLNTGGANLRLQPTASDVSGNTLPAEPWFLYTAAKYYRDQINPGLYYVVGHDHLISSSYDKGEGWTSADIQRNSTLTENFSNLYPATGGPAATINAALTGNAYNTRRYKITVNGDSVLGNLLPYMNEAVDQGSFSTNLLSSGSASAVISNVTDNCGSSSCPVDRMVVHKLEITYPRQFNFGGAANFEFALPASNGTYLEISNFNHGGVAPVLYDLTNGQRYSAELSGSLVKVVLQPSATPRKLVLASQVPANAVAINSLQVRNFINYNTAATRGDYLIISNPLLFDGANGSNPVEEYRAYRTSAEGGGFTAKIYLEDQLADQFGFGIKKNPAAIRNFILYTRSKYPVEPRFVFIIGRGVHYLHQRTLESDSRQNVRDNLEKLNLVPTFGYPASDMLLGADLSTSKPLVPVGRLTAITPAEVSTYLKKIKEYEGAQRTLSPSVSDKAWMKNVAHIIGAGDDVLDDILFQYLENYRRKVEDTLWGGKVTTFRKSSTSLVEQLSDADLTRLINEGVSLITYYGHSSATTLEFNLDDPANYNNQGKYPMFWALGCNAGNTFDYNEGRFSSRTYLSDKYVMAPDRGSINFLASTHFGVVHYLDIYNSRAYASITGPLYGKSMGELMKKTINDVYSFTTTEDFFARCNAEETVLNGDPAVTLNQQAKPDYAVTEDMVSVSPNFVSVADQSFKVKIKMVNLGKAINKPIAIEVKRQYPNGSIEIIHRDTIKGIRYSDSLSFAVPIDPIRDKGNNKISVTVDADNAVDELFETNNSTSRDLFIFEEEARPIYPQEFTILNKQNVTLKASTANPFGNLKQYRMEIDTTEKFNSSLKGSASITSSGGLLEFSPGISFTNNTVYYWRVGVVAANGTVQNWNNASFVYIGNSSNGYNQSHYYQHAKSGEIGLYLDSTSRTWRYDSVLNSLAMRNGLYGTATLQEGDLTVSVNGLRYIRSACVGYSLIFNVFNPNTFKPATNTTGQYGSALPCLPGREWNYEYSYMTAASRKKIMDFMDSIPAGSIVVVRNIMNTSQAGGFVSDWKNDETINGAGNSLYSKLKAVGFSDLDSFYRPRAFSFVYKKGGGFTPTSLFSEGAYDVLNHVVYVKSPDSVGYTISPVFGPAKTWKQLTWDGKSVEAVNTDQPTINIVGIRLNGTVDTLVRGIDQTQHSFDISTIDASIYPNLQLVLRNMDSVNFTPHQLSFWRLTFDPVPEGALAPNLYLKVKDTVDVGEPLDLQVAFKNITDSPFADSLTAAFVVTDRNNVQHRMTVPAFRRLVANDTLHVHYTIATNALVGNNTLFLDVNPNHAQPEQFHFNNFAYRNFYVRGDTLNPLLDVTFDNLHILNRDIVSAKPDILIKLKDEAKWMLLNDTSVATVQVRFPNGSLRTYRYNSDTLVFEPATGAPNASNTATIRLRPYFAEDGDYELIVTGKDMSSNAAGTMSYRVSFQILNKPMISNMLNYPNPFTTSTAFVFTLTGAEVPQNIKIQILTVTGKIVREITKEELGPIHIGRNITEYKWNGTDQFGQKLANGVYLYRVTTNQNGKSLDKYRQADDNTDKYFNKGYGKMYLMR
ncbi:putative type IX secretion system sortase PorU2 [Flavisolibacter nicotianae]|uniref:putative type IX secretion system sortase PorU2 n=1 Tax=Flavisolibacter nicotianae TaxID=2364882 RepID=UPI000EB16195|nr:C25 family cysteine peptidase [Flavisolibacter nicotianae]